MNNLIKIIIGFFFLLISSRIAAQITLQDYEEGYDYIRLVLVLDDVLLRSRNSQYGYYDESNPGKFSMPKRTIFIAVPINNNFSVSTSVLQSKQFMFDLGLNPKVKRSNDSTLTYNYSPEFIYESSESEPVKFISYRTIEKYNCAEMQIEQFVYNFSSNQINQYEKIELILKFQEPLRKNSSNTIKLPRTSTASIIINSNLTKIANLKSAANMFKTISDWFDEDLQYVKIGTPADGIYRVTGQQLENLGVNIDLIDPSTITILLHGNAIPIYVKTNSPDRFEKEDFIEFIGRRNLGGDHRSISRYGEPYKEYLDRYSDTTVYWITWNEANPCRVKEITSVGSNSSDTLNYYYEINHYEQNNWFDFSAADLVRKELPYWIENKTWGWSGLSVGTRNNNFITTNVFHGKPVRVYAKLQSYAFSNPVKSHHLAISLNSSPITDSTFINQYDQAVLSGEFSSDILIEGNNILRVHSFPVGGSINLCFFDWYEVEYPRYLIPNDGKLFSKFQFLTDKKEYQLKITNTSNTSYSLWVFGEKAKRFSVPIVNNQIIISDTISAQSELFYCEESKISIPLFYYQKKFMRLKEYSNSAEYILITNKKFLSKADDYSKFINESYSLITKVIDVDDIYDQFSYGFFNPEAIRSFLKYAFYNWQPPSIKYVFLVGGATYDYHGNKAMYQGAPRYYNYVPSFGSPVSDTWFVVFDSSKSIIPDISIGRIPVTSNQEFEWYFQKHKEYVQQPFNAWNKRVIFFSGGTGNIQSQIDALRNVNEFIIQNYVSPKPYSGRFTHFYKTINPVNNFGPYSFQQIKNVIDSGGVFISYLGHSGTQTWDNSITDPLQLQNKVNRYPLITDFGCSTGRFAEPDVISFSQAFVNYGQAIAYIANSSLGFTSTSYTFPQIFYKKILSDSVYTIGDAHRLAKLELISKYGTSGAYQLFALTNTLIGDPVIKLKLPPSPNLIISDSDIKIIDDNPNDWLDSLSVKIKISNYGLAINSSYKILIQHYYKNKINYTKEITRMIPDYTDSIFIKIPAKGLNGEHRISVLLDKDDVIKEIYEDDNTANYNYILQSGSVKYLVTSHSENYVKNPVKILLPAVRNERSPLIVEIADNEKFNLASQYQIIADRIVSDFYVDKSFQNKRIWLRTKIDPNDSMASTLTFKLSNKNSFALFDSLSFSKQWINNFKITNNLYLDSVYVKFRLLSAGLNDGNTALILKDDQNFIPENTLRGHHVAIFKGKDYQFSGYKRFDVFGGGAAVTNEYINFLDTLSSDYLVAFTLSDEGTVNSNELKNKIKEFGSKYIDKVSFRSSWAMIGRKGSPIGSVPENFALQYNGRVETDTIILSGYRSGEILTNLIGPAGKWKQLNLGLNGKTEYFNLTLLGSNETNFDTLLSTNNRKSAYDISSIDPVKYPYLKVNLKLSSESIQEVIKVDSLIIDYLKPPEIVVSDRTTSVSKDTLQQGEVISIDYKVHNVGETTAKNIKAALQLFGADGIKILDTSIPLDSIKPNHWESRSFNYDTRNLSGAFTFIINADSDKSLNEIYTDNNYLSIPFYVKRDESIPLVQIKFDELDIFDGDYISSKPEIKISISNSSIIPLSDTSSVEIYLNNDRLYYNNNSKISCSFSNTNPKMIINYKPILAEGEYLLKVIAKNPNNSTIDITTVKKKFLVSDKSQLLYVYNYPNPFSDNTYFTFKLTQIPDQLKIRIYTLAGRLIKEIIKHESELNYDFNRIEWDGKDEDGSTIANGVYIYKVIMKKGGEVITVTQKLAIVR